MLDKPKFLTGEVKEFIDWLRVYEYEPKIVMNTRSEYGLTKNEKINAYEDEMIERRELIDFYNQPFDAKMMEKYFDGWKDLMFVRSKGKYVGIDIYINIKKMFIYSISETLDFPIPKTLSQFITFILSAGLTLEWRE